MVTSPGPLSVDVWNLGGIDSLEVTVQPGVTVFVGRNATNRTSLLTSIGAAMGGSCGTLNRASEEGGVVVELDGEEYTREFERRDDAVAVDGDPYTDETGLVDLFGCLIEDNPVRRAVERGDDAELRDLLLDPVDTAAIERRVEELRQRRRRVQTRIDEIERQQSNLPALEARREELAAELEGVEAELEELRETVDERDVEATGRRAEPGVGSDLRADGPATDLGDPDDPAQTAVDRLRETREEYHRVRDERETQEAAVESLESEREAVGEDLAELTVPSGDPEDVESELEELRRRRRELASTIDNLLSIVEFNEALVSDAAELDAVDAGGADAIDELDPSGRTVECWTCGTAVERDAISDRLDDLRTIVDEKREARAELDERIDELQSELSTLRETAAERDSLQGRLEELADELEDRRDRVSGLESRESALRERIDELEAEAAERSDAESDLLEDYRRLSELEYERGQLEEQLAGLDDEIDVIDALAEERTELEAEDDDLRSELEELRGRIDRLEASAVETFNEEMETVLGLLAYENLERVWIERRTPEGSDGEDASTFVLHVVRDDGAVYEDTVDHLSESEREVVGLVVALAGSLVHDVHETVPVMMLDSLEAIDADRIAGLVGHFADVAPYLAVALLPEDAQALPDTYDRVRMGAEAP